MKRYKITLFTKSGVITENYTDNPANKEAETLAEFEKRMQDKHGDFVMLKAEEVTQDK